VQVVIGHSTGAVFAFFFCLWCDLDCVKHLVVASHVAPQVFVQSGSAESVLELVQLSSGDFAATCVRKGWLDARLIAESGEFCRRVFAWVVAGAPPPLFLPDSPLPSVFCPYDL
jgi:hypothetical protein